MAAQFFLRTPSLNEKISVPYLKYLGYKYSEGMKAGYMIRPQVRPQGIQVTTQGLSRRGKQRGGRVKNRTLRAISGHLCILRVLGRVLRPEIHAEDFALNHANSERTPISRTWRGDEDAQNAAAARRIYQV